MMTTKRSDFILCKDLLPGDCVRTREHPDAELDHVSYFIISVRLPNVGRDGQITYMFTRDGSTNLRAIVVMYGDQLFLSGIEYMLVRSSE
jgi:hypothetical protein